MVLVLVFLCSPGGANIPTTDKILYFAIHNFAEQILFDFIRINIFEIYFSNLGDLGNDAPRIFDLRSLIF